MQLHIELFLITTFVSPSTFICNVFPKVLVGISCGKNKTDKPFCSLYWFVQEILLPKCVYRYLHLELNFCWSYIHCNAYAIVCMWESQVEWFKIKESGLWQDRVSKLVCLVGGGGNLATIKCRWSPFSWWVSGLQSQLCTPLYFLCCTYLPRSSHICGLKQLWLSQSLWLVYIPQNLKRLQPHWFDLTLYASIKQLGSWSGGNSMLWRNVIVFPPPHPPPPLPHPHSEPKIQSKLLQME